MEVSSYGAKNPSVFALYKHYLTGNMESSKIRQKETTYAIYAMQCMLCIVYNKYNL